MRLPRRDESGFTLVELLITTIIVGIITFAVGTALLIGLKTTFETGERLGQSNNSQQLGGFLLPDVASAAPGGIDLAATAPFGCSGPVPGGPNVLALSWTDALSGQGTRVSYRYEAPLLNRYACTGGGSPTRTTVLRALKAVPTVVNGATTVVLSAVVVQDQTTGADYAFSVRATRRTPSTVCEPEQSSIVITPVPVSLSGSNLASSLSVAFATSGPCTSAAVDYEYGATAAVRTAPAITAGGGNWTATIPAGGGGWTPGTKAVQVRAGTLSATASFLVVDPNACAITAGPTATPNPSARSGAVLLAPVVVTWTTTGTCPSGGSMVFQHGATPSDVTTVTASRTGSNWVATAPVALPAPAAWTDGPKSYTVFADVASASGSFTVAPAVVCAILTPPTASPATVALSKGHVASGANLAGPVVVTFTTETTCTSASLSYSVGDDAMAVTTVVATRSGGTWTATIPARAPGTSLWTAGSKVLTARTGLLTRTGSFTVTAGCGATSGLTLIPATGQVDNGGKLRGPVTVAFTTSAGCTAADLVLRYQHGNAAVDSSSAPVSGGPTSWTATLPENPPGGGKWTTGSKRVWLTVGAPGDEVVTETTLQVNP